MKRFPRKFRYSSRKKIKRGTYCQSFAGTWFQDPNLKDWIQKDPHDNYNVKCKICEKCEQNYVDST